MEVALLLGVRGVPGRGPVRGQSGRLLAALFKEMRTYGVEAAAGRHPAVVLEPLEQGESGTRSRHHADCDGVVESDDRVVIQSQQHAVEGGDLLPIRHLGALGFVVDGSDRRLELVGTGCPCGSAAVIRATPSAIVVGSHRLRS